MAKRQSIYSDAFAHQNPIPAACRMGNLLMTGVINGGHPSQSDHGSLEDQCARMFARIAEVMKAAGSDIDHIVKLNVGMADPAQRAVLNRFWVEMFPDPANRPVRQTSQVTLEPGKLVQCDIVAWID